jgi:SH3-like domain-containing protein
MPQSARTLPNRVQARAAPAVLSVLLAASLAALGAGGAQAQGGQSQGGQGEVIPGQDGVDAGVTGALGSAAKGARLSGGRTGPSGLPLPRFASLKSGDVNLRVGPGKEHPILWNYIKAGLPVEIVLEFDTWRKIRDAEGVEGWVYQSMLSGRRMAQVEPHLAARADGIASIIETSAAAPQNLVAVHAKPDAGSRVAARFEAGVNVEVLTCDGTWCSVKAGDHAGWMEQARLWGVYPGETIDD